eukprot:gnl/MRDRNA2_/MRDRNA2_73285_c0_seq1.p1 gnl/MRDRNA2_/MRDRNA2_73285_c0~~gnl/MRDRNA2_/MRDRNA2_73285_c0_seq1.p1  ORF type:complete len:107 (-),score=4.80 gnl/MRDRNA2_/MRDRNA2_73285_c0_seq1:49-369(-)
MWYVYLARKKKEALLQKFLFCGSSCPTLQKQCYKILQSIPNTMEFFKTTETKLSEDETSMTISWKILLITIIISKNEIRLQCKSLAVPKNEHKTTYANKSKTNQTQ